MFDSGVKLCLGVRFWSGTRLFLGLLLYWSGIKLFLGDNAESGTKLFLGLLKSLGTKLCLGERVESGTKLFLGLRALSGIKECRGDLLHVGSSISSLLSLSSLDSIRAISGIILCLGLRLTSGGIKPAVLFPSIGETAILALRPGLVAADLLPELLF